ncbi:multicopper oxidase domain-containing protein [Streptosporangium canum]|uniref:multicopper oxidase domain-containing protein n=1 Tax=Streptosporangium canum TaxID=324952 RepID=UPI0037B740AC
MFDLKMQPGTTQFEDGKPTETWGFNGSYLGPTLRAKHGEKVVVNVDNALTQPSTVHWHGMHLPARMDGGPHQMIAPGEQWSPTWTIDQAAASLWYHPHPHGETEEHVQRGLAGMFFIDDDTTQQARLPHDYGRNDIPLIVQDTKFNNDGSFDHSRPPRRLRLPRRPDPRQRHPRPLPAGQRRTRTAAPSQRLHRPYPQLRFRRQPQLLPDSHRRRTPQHPRTNGAPPALPDRASP